MRGIALPKAVEPTLAAVEERLACLGVRRQSAAATALLNHEASNSRKTARESGVALRLPPQSKKEGAR